MSLIKQIICKIFAVLLNITLISKSISTTNRLVARSVRGGRCTSAPKKGTRIYIYFVGSATATKFANHNGVGMIE